MLKFFFLKLAIVTLPQVDPKRKYENIFTTCLATLNPISIINAGRAFWANIVAWGK